MVLKGWVVEFWGGESEDELDSEVSFELPSLTVVRAKDKVDAEKKFFVFMRKKFPGHWWSINSIYKE